MTLSAAHLAAAQQQILRPPVKANSGPTLWCDCSNWTKNLTDQGCADLKAAKIVGCIIQAVTGLDGRTYTRQQLDACLRNGLRIQGYVWCYPNAPIGSMTDRLALFDGFPIEQLWLDVEQAGLKISDVNRDLAICDLWMGDGSPTGVYTGRWFVEQQGWLGWTAWSNRPLWDSAYDHIADIDTGFVPYGGWTRRAVKQFFGTSSIGTVNQIDLNVMR